MNGTFHESKGTITFSNLGMIQWAGNLNENQAKPRFYASSGPQVLSLEC